MKKELKAIKLPKKKEAIKQLALVVTATAILSVLICGFDGVGVAIMGFLNNL